MANITFTFNLPDQLVNTLPAISDNKNVILVDSDQAYSLLHTVLDLVTAQNARNAITDDFCAD